MVHDEVIRPADLPVYLAAVGTELVGLITYRITADCGEVVSFDCLQLCIGSGMALLEQVETAAEEYGCSQMWLVATNDKLEALRFY